MIKVSRVVAASSEPDRPGLMSLFSHNYRRYPGNGHSSNPRIVPFNRTIKPPSLRPTVLDPLGDLALLSSPSAFLLFLRLRNLFLAISIFLLLFCNLGIRSIHGGPKKLGKLSLKIYGLTDIIHLRRYII